MEQQQRSLFFTAAVGLIILAIIVGSVYYLVKFIQTRVSSSRQLPQASVESIAEASATPVLENIQGEQVIPQNTIQPVQGSIQSGASTARPTPTPTPETKGGVTIAGDRKVFNWGNIQMSYPKSWGLVTCTNSKNAELDPNNPLDSKIACNIAIKPVTVLVDDILNCAGESVKVGTIEVIKSRKVDGGYTAYHWCTKTVPVLNITHRVSPGSDPASSKEDYSKQIEEMISKLTFSKS